MSRPKREAKASPTPLGGWQSPEKNLKNEKETHLALSGAVVGNRFRADHPAGLSRDLHLFSLSAGSGYGDIVAVHPMARMLVTLEGVTG